MEYDVRVDCSCGNYLGYMKQTDGGWINVDNRAQSSPPRLSQPNGAWHGYCRKCGATPRVQTEKLERALVTVSAAGLRAMPFRGL